VEVPPGLAALLVLVPVDGCLWSLGHHQTSRIKLQRLSTLSGYSVATAVAAQVLACWNAVQQRLGAVSTEVL
jgi:hypothetical protein